MPSLFDNDSAHVHAVTNAGSNTYSYDANGSQITRVIGGQTYTLSYNAENQLVGVTGPSMTASFVGVHPERSRRDGGGARVKSTINGTTTYFVGGHYEVTGSQVTKYYFAGSQRIAIRKNGTLSYMLSDHLGSTVATTNTSGQLASGQLYKAWGEVRYALGTSPTKYTFTGQYSNVSDFGLLFYNARWYDPYLNHFTQPDSIVPDPYNSQDYDRYSYARNNPLKYNDPSGHYVCTGYNEKWGKKTCYDVINSWLDFLYNNGGTEGQNIVDAFRQADAEYTIRFSFESDLGGAYMNTDFLLRSIGISINAGTATDYNGIGAEASALAHELYHLTNQKDYEQATAAGEKEAYDFEAQLLENMGIPLEERPPVKDISGFGNLVDVKNYLVTNFGYQSNMPLQATNPLGNLVYTAGTKLVRALVVIPLEVMTGCYGPTNTVCLVPGGEPQYQPPQ